VVREQAKLKDKSEGTVFLTPEQRDEHRVIIRQGKFYEREFNNEYTLCDTTERISHEKTSYAAYTINLKGEISLFDHFEIADQYAHSSMNAQAPLFAAGEIQIHNGELKALTVYSQHYKPTLNTLYEVLSYFIEHGIDIANVLLRTWGLNNEYKGNVFIDYKASEFYETFKVSGLSAIQPVNSIPIDLGSINGSLSAEFVKAPFEDFEPNFTPHTSSSFFAASSATKIQLNEMSTNINEKKIDAFEDFEVDFSQTPSISSEDTLGKLNKSKK